MPNGDKDPFSVIIPPPPPPTHTQSHSHKSKKGVDYQSGNNLLPLVTHGDELAVSVHILIFNTVLLSELNVIDHCNWCLQTELILGAILHMVIILITTLGNMPL